MMPPMRTSMLMLVLAFAASGCDKTEPTPAGTVVLDWKANPKLTVSGWTLGAPKGDAGKAQAKYRFEAGSLGKPIRFELAVEHGSSELVDATPAPDKPEAILAPRAVKITIVENPSWAATGRCDDELAVPLEVRPDGTSAYPKSVWASCQLVLKRKNGDITISIHFDVHGDGRIQTYPSGPDTKLVAE